MDRRQKPRQLWRNRRSPLRAQPRRHGSGALYRTRALADADLALQLAGTGTRAVSWRQEACFGPQAVVLHAGHSRDRGEAHARREEPSAVAEYTVFGGYGTGRGGVTGVPFAVAAPVAGNNRSPGRDLGQTQCAAKPVGRPSGRRRGVVARTLPAHGGAGMDKLLRGHADCRRTSGRGVFRCRRQPDPQRRGKAFA